MDGLKFKCIFSACGFVAVLALEKLIYAKVFV